MKDFYSLFAMFQNIDESGQIPYSQFVDDMPAPTLLLSDDATDARLANLSKQIAQREKDVDALRESARGSFAEWLKSKPATPTVQGLVAAFSFDEIADKKSTNSVDSSKPAHAHEDPKLIPGKMGQAAELDGENGFTFPGVGNFTRTDPFSIALWLQTASHAERQVILHHSKAPADAGSRGYELLLENGHLTVGLHHQWPGNSITVRCKSVVPTNEWVHVAFTYDGSSHASGLRIFINGKPSEVDVIRDHLWKDITYESGEPELAIGYRFRDSGFKQGKVDDFRIFNRALTPIEVANVAGLEELRTARDGDALLDYYIANCYPPARQLTSELKSLRRDQSRLINPIA